VVVGLYFSEQRGEAQDLGGVTAELTSDNGAYRNCRPSEAT